MLYKQPELNQKFSLSCFKQPPAVRLLQVIINGDQSLRLYLQIRPVRLGIHTVCWSLSDVGLAAGLSRVSEV